MDTFYRDYRLTVGIGNQAVIIEPPITVSFKALETVDKKSLGKLSVSINGLKPSTRLQLLKSEDEEKYIPVRLEVGYDGKLRQVFQGSVKSGAVKREGAIPTFLTVSLPEDCACMRPSRIPITDLLCHSTGWHPSCFVAGYLPQYSRRQPDRMC